MRFIEVIRATLLCGGAALCILGCNNSSSSSVVSDPASGVFAGTVLDGGIPVANAQVSIQGIAAETMTDSDGTFYVSDPELADLENLEISVLREGYDPVFEPVIVGLDGTIDIHLVRDASTPTLSMTSPSGERTFVVPAGCVDPSIRVEGFATLGAPENFRVDIAIVIDRSGSTSKDAFDVDEDLIIDSVLDVELAAAQCFIDGLDFDVTRVCLIEFNDSAAVVEGFTDDLDDLTAAIDGFNGSGGGTNYEAAFTLVTDEFLDLAAADALAEELPDGAGDSLPEPLRLTVFLSDGIPTSHGVPRDFSDSNLTQSSDDRDAAIDSALAMGDATGSHLFAFSILPEDDTNKTRTTLPQCVSACGAGHYENVPEFEDLEEALCATPLEPSVRVTITQDTMGLDPLEVPVFGDGFFSEVIPVDLDDPTADPGPTDPDNTVLNTLTVTMHAYSGALEQTVDETITVRLISETDLATLTNAEMDNAQYAEESVVDIGELRTPTAGELGDSELFDFIESEYEDAVEIIGGETFRVIDPSGGGASTVALTLDFVYKEACYESDFGYIVVDPDDPPDTAFEALFAVPASQVLFNSGDLGGACDQGSVAAGTARYTINVDTDQTIVFFIIPNRELADYQASPKGGLQPLFTMSHLNPGGFDQVLSFRSVDGRTAPGPDASTVTAGPLTIFAFEDLSITRRRSDQDFSDVVFTISEHIVGNVDPLVCE